MLVQTPELSHITARPKFWTVQQRGHAIWLPKMHKPICRSFGICTALNAVFIKYITHSGTTWQIKKQVCGQSVVSRLLDYPTDCWTEKHIYILLKSCVRPPKRQTSRHRPQCQWVASCGDRRVTVLYGLRSIKLHRLFFCGLPLA